MGVIYLNRAELDEALSFFEQALEIQPDNLMAHWNIANALQQKGDYPKALDELRKVLALNPPELVQKEVQAEIEILQKKIEEIEAAD